MNEYEETHQEYRRQLQYIIEQLKVGNTNLQSELHDLEWSVRNDLNRINIIGEDAFEDEYEDLSKFLPVVDAIKKKFNFNYQIDENSFDDYGFDDEDDEDEVFESDFIEILDENQDELEDDYFEGELVEGEFLDLFPEFEDLDESNDD